ncbi:hypothetical protein F5X99DRAFT_407376 [Biscogniauxia marginata]|nr:hypothetical protein F5X99DRAFT_407376 [Biscogniauxia marginata]
MHYLRAKQFIRLVAGNRLLQYPEEKPDFKLPEPSMARDVEVRLARRDAVKLYPLVCLIHPAPYSATLTLTGSRADTALNTEERY